MFESMPVVGTPVRETILTEDPAIEHVHEHELMTEAFERAVFNVYGQAGLYSFTGGAYKKMIDGGSRTFVFYGNIQLVAGPIIMGPPSIRKSEIGAHGVRSKHHTDPFMDVHFQVDNCPDGMIITNVETPLVAGGEAHPETFYAVDLEKVDYPIVFKDMIFKSKALKSWASLKITKYIKLLGEDNPTTLNENEEMELWSITFMFAPDTGSAVRGQLVKLFETKDLHIIFPSVCKEGDDDQVVKIIDAFGFKMAVIRKKFDKLEKRVGVVEEKVIKMEDKVVKMEDKQSIFTFIILTLIGWFMKLATKHTDLETKTTDLETKTTDLETKTTDLETDTRNKTNYIAHKVAEVETKTADNATKAAALETKTADNATKAAALETKTADLQTAALETKKGLAGVSNGSIRRNAKVADQVAKAQDALSAVKGTTDKLTRVINVD